MLYDRPAQSLQETLRRRGSGRDNPGAGAALSNQLQQRAMLLAQLDQMNWTLASFQIGDQVE